MATTAAPPPVEKVSPGTTPAPAKSTASRLGKLTNPVRAILSGPWQDPGQRLIIILVSCSSLSLLMLIWYVADRRSQPIPAPVLPNITLEDSLSALARGSNRQALEVLEQLEQYEMLTKDQTGGADLVRGVILAQDAERMWDQDRIRMAKQALHYLDKAHSHGVPAEYEPLQLYWYSVMLVEAGQSGKARDIVAAALTANPERATELNRLGAIAWAAEPGADLARALEYNTAYLATPKLEVTPQQEALLARARLLFGLDRADESRQILQALRPDTNTVIDGLLLEAELTIQAAKKSAGPTSADLYRQAIQLLKKASDRAIGRERVIRQALLWTGICYQALQETNKAYETFEKTRQLSPTSPEGITAAIYAAKLAGELNLQDDLLQTLLAAIQAAGPISDYQNPLYAKEAFRNDLQNFYQQLFKSGDYSAAIQLALAMSDFCGVELAHDLAAQARLAWAQKFLAEAEQIQSATADELRQQAAEQYRLAGQDYAAVAAARFTSPDYLEQIWKSAEYSIQGEDYTAALAQLEIYLQNELRNRRPLAMLRRGECQLMLGQPVQALETLEECIETYPRDAASFRARVLAAQAHLDKNSRERAKTLYLVNLESGQLSPASSEWRDSLFALGQLFFEEAQALELGSPANTNPAILSETEQQVQQLYQESISRLEEAVERYPNFKRIISTRYMIAEAYRRLAVYPRRRLAVSTIRSAREEFQKELRQLLNAAIAQDLNIQQSLGNRRENQVLTNLEHALLRNCFFSHGASLFELERYREAASVYLTMINRYQSEPQVLDAYTQLIKCYRQLGQREEARAALEQARSALTRLQTTTTDFSATTNHDPAEWQLIIDWLAKQ